MPGEAKNHLERNTLEACLMAGYNMWGEGVYRYPDPPWVSFY